MSIPTPLSHSDFYVLLALSRGEAHGYDIGAIAHNDSLQRVPMPDGKLYPLLKKLCSQDLIEEVGLKPAGKSGQERRYYQITKAGTFRLKEEFERLEHAIKIGKKAQLLDNKIPIEIQKWLEQVR